MLYPETCVINPTSADVKLVLKDIRGCEWRGFFTDNPREESACIIFSGYGATHNSARMYFKLKWITNCFIIQKNGDVSVDGLDREDDLNILFEQEQIEFFKLLAKHLGNSDPKLIPME